MKDERLGFRVSGELKSALTEVAKAEGRSLGQVCELMLRAGIEAYAREGANYLRQILSRGGKAGAKEKR